MNVRYQEFGDWDKKICQLFEETAEQFKGKNSQIKKIIIIPNHISQISLKHIHYSYLGWYLQTCYKLLMINI